MTVHLCALEPNQQTAGALLGFLKLVDKDDVVVCYGAGKSLIHWLFANEPDVPSTRQPSHHTVHEQLKQRLKQAQWFILQEPAETGTDQALLHIGATPIGHEQLLALIRKCGPTVTWKT